MKPKFNQSHINLKQLLYSMFDRKETDTDEFKAFIAMYGREKIMAVYNEWKKEKEMLKDFKVKASGETNE